MPKRIKDPCLSLLCALSVVSSASTALAQSEEAATTDDTNLYAQTSTPADTTDLPGLSPAAADAPDAEPADATDVAAAPQASAPPVETILVTGSRIRRSNLSSPVPVTIVDSDFIDNSASIFLSDILAQTPQLQPSFTSANSTRLIGTAGFGGVNLRNLGINRTLLLVNGRRHVGSASLSPAVDLNTIPVDLIERFEVLTGGASATYGADAMAGVVNVILKESFEGFSVRSQYNVSARGDAESWFISALAGADFADSKGNALLSIEYTQRDQLSSTERDFGRLDTRTLPNPDDMDTATVNDGVPDEILTPNAGLNFLNRRGVVFPTFGPSATQQTFNDDGSIRPFDFGIPAPNGFEQQNGDFLRLGGLDDLLPNQERLVATTLLSYNLDKAVQFYAEGKFVLTQTDGRIGSGQPSFDNGSADLTIFRDNAFLPSGLGQQFDAMGIDSTIMRRFNVDLGNRETDIQRITVRTAVGFKGDIGDNVSYDVGLTWGRTSNTVATGNNRLNARFFAASDAVVDVNGEVNGRPGEIVCRVNLQAARGEMPTLPDGSPAPDFVLGDNQGNCVPTSVFGDGAVGADAARFINQNTSLRETIEQLQLMGFVTGSSKGLFELPGGAIDLVIGAEYRQDQATQFADLGDSLGLTFFNAFSPTDGEIEVSEVFGEISIPIVRGLPGIEELLVSGGGRISSYNLDQVGTVFTAQANGVYRPTDDLSIRASFSRAIRSPNVGDAFSGLSQSFFAVDDPCDEDSINDATQTRVDNCVALAERLGVPFVPGTTDLDDASTREGVVGGNPDIQEETSTSWTIGGVLTPRWIPGLLIAFDYYNFTIDDAIGTPGAQRIIDNCVDLPSIDNQFCDLITRNSANFDIDLIQSVNVNLSSLETTGFDINAAYRFSLEDALDLFGVKNVEAGFLGFNFNANHLFRWTNFPDQNAPDERQDIDGFLGDTLGSVPKWRFNLTTNYTLEDFTFTWRVQWTDGFNRAADNSQEFARNPDALSPTNVPDRGYHFIQARYRFLEDFQVYAGIDNLFDTDPPFGFDGTTVATGFYDNIGRSFYFGARWDAN